MPVMIDQIYAFVKGCWELNIDPEGQEMEMEPPQFDILLRELFERPGMQDCYRDGTVKMLGVTIVPRWKKKQDDRSYFTY